MRKTITIELDGVEITGTVCCLPDGECEVEDNNAPAELRDRAASAMLDEAVNLDWSDTRNNDFDDSYFWDDEPDFAYPGSNSALRASSPSNPRNCPCPTCGQPDRLTPADVAHGYQCDSCADKAERGGDY